ncbi:nicotinamide riboside kinase 1 [Protopterus annectens]|uniref:nicotinamide riboside kinase 1 n=1 Tax=Protopterus annectens TaxID=7888 RepID=UPI001CFA9C75|nr:nicotinamide riboside kinase 1 [Protopterus annectens]XP_043916781.1 nicotinamide riboside kinase 1 [Protopterus annectens]
MKTLIIGIGGVTNGGKTTLATRLKQKLPNCMVVSQDDYFKPDSEIEIDEYGVKQYDVIDAVDMEAMMAHVCAWISNPKEHLNSKCDHLETNSENWKEVYILIVEGFLLYNYRPLDDVIHKRYYLCIPYDVCKSRRSSRSYNPPDPPGYFERYVWPLYMKNKLEMEQHSQGLVYIDGTKSKDEIFFMVIDDILGEIKKCLGWKNCIHDTSVSGPTLIN